MDNYTDDFLKRKSRLQCFVHTLFTKIRILQKFSSLCTLHKGQYLDIGATVEIVYRIFYISFGKDEMRCFFEFSEN